MSGFQPQQIPLLFCWPLALCRVSYVFLELPGITIFVFASEQSYTLKPLTYWFAVSLSLRSRGKYVTFQRGDSSEVQTYIWIWASSRSKWIQSSVLVPFHLWLWQVKMLPSSYFYCKINQWKTTSFRIRDISTCELFQMQIPFIKLIWLMMFLCKG